MSIDPKDVKSSADAPLHYSADEGIAWAEGFNTARCEAIEEIGLLRTDLERADVVLRECGTVIPALIKEFGMRGVGDGANVGLVTVATAGETNVKLGSLRKLRRAITDAIGGDDER